MLPRLTSMHRGSECFQSLGDMIGEIGQAHTLPQAILNPYDKLLVTVLATVEHQSRSTATAADPVVAVDRLADIFAEHAASTLETASTCLSDASPADAAYG
jgi:CO dehydrogenase nickel-insertion accessory protein CooC1